MIGAIAGVVVVFSVLFFDKIRIDDPVGAISVHGVCGAWGTLAAGLFNMDGMTLKIVAVQLTGIVSCFAWTFTLAFILFKVIEATIGLRVSREEEMEGLDSTEHGVTHILIFQPSTMVSWGLPANLAGLAMNLPPLMHPKSWLIRHKEKL